MYAVRMGKLYALKKKQKKNTTLKSAKCTGVICSPSPSEWLVKKKTGTYSQSHQLHIHPSSKHQSSVTSGMHLSLQYNLYLLLYLPMFLYLICFVLYFSTVVFSLACIYSTLRFIQSESKKQWKYHISDISHIFNTFRLRNLPPPEQRKHLW